MWLFDNYIIIRLYIQNICPNFNFPSQYTRNVKLSELYKNLHEYIRGEYPMTMSIKQVADKLNIPISTIRYYDKMGLFPFIERDNNGYRCFTEDDLFWIELITCMRSVGMSITTLQHIVNLHMQGPKTLPERKEIFHNQKAKLLAEKEKIEQAIYKVDEKMTKLDSLN